MELPADILGLITTHISDFTTWCNWRLVSRGAYIRDDHRFDIQYLRLILKRPDIPYDWAVLTQRAPISFIIAYSDLPWNWQMASRKRSITLNDIKSRFTKPWDWNQLTMWAYTYSPNEIKDNLHLPWDYSVLSGCEKNINDLIINNKDLPWNWGQLSHNSYITPEVVLATITKPWSIAVLVSRGVIPQEMLHRGMIAYDWSRISRLPHIGADFMAAHPEFPWHWMEAVHARKISADFIIGHPEISWNWKVVSQLL